VLTPHRGYGLLSFGKISCLPAPILPFPVRPGFPCSPFIKRISSTAGHRSPLSRIWYCPPAFQHSWVQIPPCFHADVFLFPSLLVFFFTHNPNSSSFELWFKEQFPHPFLPPQLIDWSTSDFVFGPTTSPLVTFLRLATFLRLLCQNFLNTIAAIFSF